MKLNAYVYVKTTRTKKGYAHATLSRFMNYSENKIRYGFHFYRTCKFFDTYKELRDFVESNYELLEYNFLKGMIEYHLPEEKKNFFK